MQELEVKNITVPVVSSFKVFNEVQKYRKDTTNKESKL